MSTGRRNRLAGQIGEYLVCAELGRRGLMATSFSGNVPTFDVVAADESCRTLAIQVKTTRSNNWPGDARKWMDIEFDEVTQCQRFRGPAVLSTPSLIYVCVAIGETKNDDRFFVMKMDALQRICIAGYSAWMESHGWRRPQNPHSYDCRWTVAQLAEFEDNWDLIKATLAAEGPGSAALVRG